MKSGVKWSVAAAASLCVSLWAIACGPTGGSYCSDQRDCMGGNDQDEDVCNSWFDYQKDIASTQGCKDEFNAYFKCFFDLAKCVTTNTGHVCHVKTDCEESPAGATCDGAECVVKTLALQDQTECEQEKLDYSNCNKLGEDPFPSQ